MEPVSSLKPRIRPRHGWVGPRRALWYVCRGHGHIGHGFTMEHAYRNWVVNRRSREALGNWPQRHPRDFVPGVPID